MLCFFKLFRTNEAIPRLIHRTLKVTAFQFGKRMPCFPDPADSSGRDPCHEGEIWNVSCDHGPGCHDCPPADSHGGHTHGPGPNGGPFLDGDPNSLPVISILQFELRGDRPWKQIVGEHRCWPNEDAVFESGGFVHKCIILNFAVSCQGDTCSDVGPSSYDATCAQLSTLTHLGVVPYLHVLSQNDVFTQIDRGMNE